MAVSCGVMILNIPLVFNLFKLFVCRLRQFLFLEVHLFNQLLLTLKDPSLLHHLLCAYVAGSLRGTLSISFIGEGWYCAETFLVGGNLRAITSL